MRDAYHWAMRTTVNLDERVAIAARARARRLGISLGQAVSELALAGLEVEQAEFERPSLGGLLLLPAAEGHQITNEMVAEALDDE